MTGRHRLPDDHPAQPAEVPPWGRILIYALCIVLPFASLVLGVTTGERATMAVVTLLGAVGPALAIVYTPKNKGEE